MTNDIKVCGLVICALCVCFVFKNMKSEYSLFVRIAITIGVSIFSLSVIYPIFTFINDIANKTPARQYIPTLIKAMGIAICVEITADICKDGGEEALSKRVALFGRAEILILSIPLIKDLFSLCQKILN